MKTTRRGFVGVLGATGASAAAVVFGGDKKEEELVNRVVPTFKIDVNTGPPFKAGDVVRDTTTLQLFLVKHSEAARERVTSFKHRGAVSESTTVRDADPGDGLVLVPLLNLQAGGGPIEAWDEGGLVRCGTAG